MLGKIAYVHCWYDVRNGKTLVQLERLIQKPDTFKTKMFLNPSGASMARLANVITNRCQGKITTFADGYTACISPPQVVADV